MPYYLTAQTVRNLYNECQWKNGDLDSQHLKVTSVTGEVHHIHERKLYQHKNTIESLLIRYMPDTLMRTKGCTGMPWYTFMWDRDGYQRLSEKYVALFLVLSSACGAVSLSVNSLKGLVEKVTYGIINDGEIRFNRRRIYKKGLEYTK